MLVTDISFQVSCMSQNKKLKMEPVASGSSNLNTQIQETSADAETQTLQDVGLAGASNVTQSTQEGNRKIFDANQCSFKEAVKWIGYVDTTLLIAELLSETQERRVIIFAPKRFGKSLNMYMIKCFFEIEADRDISYAPQSLKELEQYANFKAFCRYGLAPPCEIMKEERLIKEYFGRHPVVYLDFKDLECTSTETVRSGLKRLVHNAYVKFSYLLNSNEFAGSPSKAKAEKQNFEAWYSHDTYQNMDVKDGLQKLIKYLHNHHKRKVYLLVDEFDAPSVHALLAGKNGDQVREISNEVMSLLGAVVKGKVADKNLLGSLITGVSYLGSIGISEHLNNIPYFKWLLGDQGRFSDFYGIRDKKLTTLLANVFPEQEEKQVAIREEVLKLYNGYYFKGQAIYSLWSILHYIRLRVTLDASEIKKKTFWGGSSIITKLGKVLRNSDFLEQMISVAGGHSLYFTPSEKVDAEDLANFLNGEQGDEDILFSFFMEQGYFSHFPTPRDNVRRHTTEIYVKVPNAEVLFGIQEMFRNFCVTVCGLSNLAMKNCAKIFQEIPVDKSTKDPELIKILQNAHSELKNLLLKFKDQVINERSIQASLYITMLKVGFPECRVEQHVTIQKEDKKNTGFIDLWMFDDGFAIIWEFKYNRDERGDCSSTKESAHKALLEILFGSEDKQVPYIEILTQRGIKKYLLIGLSMGSECKPFMCCLGNSLDQNDCVFFPEE